MHSLPASGLQLMLYVLTTISELAKILRTCEPSCDHRSVAANIFALILLSGVVGYVLLVCVTRLICQRNLKDGHKYT
jgi:hypothetical protein